MKREATRRIILFSGAVAALAVACGGADGESDERDDDGSAGAGSEGGGPTTGQGGTTSGPGGGGGIGGAGSGGGSAGACGLALVVQGSNYGVDPHEIMIPIADLEAGVERTYVSTPGTGSHTHAVTLTAADFAALRNGETVTKYSCRTPATQTDHEWAISCADPSIQPILQGDFGTEDNCPA